MKILVNILVNLVLLASSISVIYIAYYLLKTDLKNKQINAQLEEEKDDCKKQIYELNKRLTKLEKENNNEERDNIRKNKASNRTIR